MKAVLLLGYGGVDQLMYGDFPDPHPAAGEVVVRVISTSVNPIDYKIRSGAMKERMKLEFPVILGRDVAGEVTELGEGVTKFKRGDLVMGLVNHSYAEYLSAKADDLARIPEGLGPKDAGVLPLVTETGAQLIENGVRPRSGETVLVTGAAGGVGRTAVHVAKQHGATVIAGVKHDQKDEAQSLGADRVTALDDEAGLSTIPELDAIADTIGGATIGRLIGKAEEIRAACIRSRQTGRSRERRCAGRFHAARSRSPLPVGGRFPEWQIENSDCSPDEAQRNPGSPPGRGTASSRENRAYALTPRLPSLMVRSAPARARPERLGRRILAIPNRAPE